MDDHRRGLEDGTRRMRDDVICTMIGFQNECGLDENNPEYKAYQKVMDYIEKSYGELMQPVKLL